MAIQKIHSPTPITTSFLPDNTITTDFVLGVQSRVSFSDDRRGKYRAKAVTETNFLII